MAQTQTSILIVEDEVIVAENIRTKLERLGYAIADVVSTGEQAIQKALKYQVDVVLMDIELEGKIDGIDAAKHLHLLYDVPVIYLTAYADEKTLQRAKLAEPFGYLIKPFQTRELHSCIEMAIYRHQLERMLKDSEERYRRLIAAVTDYIYTVRVQDGRAESTEHSATCIAVTGYTQEEFRKNPHLWIQMVYDADCQMVIERTERLMEGQNVEPYEHRIIRKDGAVRWVRNTSVLHHDKQGVLISYDGLVQDITERKESELALQQERESLTRRVEERTAELQQANAELARAARMKDEFLATMSHEFRTPLHTILGMTEALQEEIFGALTQKQRDALNSIDESGRHLLAIIRDILDLAKIGAGKLELLISPVNIENVCQASLRFIKQEASKKRIAISFDFQAAMPTLDADERRLKQIFVNLLSNAVKFTPEGGQVGLDVRSEHDHQVHFTVWDTGIGISPEDIQRLFQPFVQLDGTFTRRHPGTGLGLSLVSRMVEMHGGHISVTSTVGKGSRFTVSLPVHNASLVQHQEQIQEESTISPGIANDSAPNNSTTAPMILVADDHETNAEMLAEYLKLKGYAVAIAKDGKEALEQTIQMRPAAILMDIQMPVMGGLEAIQHIRALPDMSPAIIALTALAMPGDRERCIEAGANEYMSKPVNLRKLDGIIHKLLNR
ncbi:two-component hybrid sensor and regulator [Candidatus Moduliflexus flocculans]|uniref:histidine kinase n=1 Tax=Candidatus Moduliflexus flocculans TaxID=1499966 RepID=A0A0S6VVK8_9BACT|nr:two-component hybrid sensor and regulator [Candidatus Moduliflexus flocculans]